MDGIVDLHRNAADRVQLAFAAPFCIGRLSVDPPTRQVSDGSRHETLEPRVMEVLVALARAGGRVVPRDELVDCCWEGRAVSEDAINRVVARLRHLACGLGRGSFAIETIRSVGYRLTVGPAQLSADAHSPVSRRTLVAGGVAAIAAGAAGLAWLRPPQRHQPLALALQFYQRGIQTRGQASIELSEQGAAFFREATRLDPQFADAWGALAWNYRGLLEYGPRLDAPRMKALARSAAARALALDPDNGDAQAALLMLKPFYGNWAEIERGCRRLLRAHPNHDILEFNLGQTLAEVGRPSDALRYFQRVADRQPFWPLAHLRLVITLCGMNRFEEAEDLIDQGMQRWPRRLDYWQLRMRLLMSTGRIAEAMQLANDPERLPAYASHPLVGFQLETARGLMTGTQRGLDDAFAAIADAVRKEPGLLPCGAVSAALLKKVDDSFAMLQGYYFGEGPWAVGFTDRRITELLFMGPTAILQGDTRFGSILERTGLEAYWRATGTQPDYRQLAPALVG
jgi:DNA-binding winged helix-turn-helix (wHTH) protein/tetratricopeptide (TPR) repeat protein